MLPFLCACVCEHLEYRQLINHVKRIMVFWFTAQLDAIKCFVQLLVLADYPAQLVHSLHSSITQFKDRQNCTQHQEAPAMLDHDRWSALVQNKFDKTDNDIDST